MSRLELLELVLSLTVQIVTLQDQTINKQEYKHA